MTTNTRETPIGHAPRRKGRAVQQEWQLQEAKARFSEVLRLARERGSQRVTKHGREAVVVLTAEEYARLAVSEARKGSLADFFAASRSVIRALIWTGRAISEETSSCERLFVGYERNLRAD